MEKKTYPRVRPEKTRFNLTMYKTDKALLEEIAREQGISLNALVVQAVLTKYKEKK